MAPGSGWRLLTSSLKVRGNPTLLIKHEISTSNTGRFSSLKVYVTDLTYLWTGIQEKKDLTSQAWNTEIDPVDQFDLLLEYLGKGLDGSPTTSLSISSLKGRSRLALHLKTPLPGDLRPLEWDFHLQQASEMDFTREFVLTLLGGLHETKLAMEDLVQKVRERDYAIKRVETALQARNIELTELFDKRVYGEGIADRNKRATLENKITGLVPFDHQRWQDKRNSTSLPSVRDVNKTVFTQALDSNISADSLAQEAWWESLGSGIELDEPSQISQPAFVHRQSTTGFEPSQFNTQEVRGNGRRNGLRSSSPIQPEPRPTSNGDKADDGNDSDATASTMSDLETPALTTPPRRIGKIGGHKPLPQQHRSPNLNTSPPRITRPDSTSTDPNPTDSRPRGRIGRIGGVRNAQQQDSEPSRGPSEELPTRDAIPARPTDEDRSRRRSDVQETAEELANRRRAELKHDLEEKRKAPVKKKRKF